MNPEFCHRYCNQLHSSSQWEEQMSRIMFKCYVVSSWSAKIPTQDENIFFKMQNLNNGVKTRDNNVIKIHGKNQAPLVTSFKQVKNNTHIYYK